MRSCFLIATCAVLVGCGTVTLEPYGETIVEVHTDMAVPKLIGALRFDLYDADGRWYLSRDLATPSADDWPISFGVISRDLDRGARTYLRLRAYPAGRLRDYHGERYEPRPSYTTPLVPETLQQLCADAPRIALPDTLTVRRGEAPVTAPVPAPVPKPSDDCEDDGSIDAVNGVHVQIDQPGLYRFELVATNPPMSTAGPSDNLLFLRRDCPDSSSQLGCNDDRDSIPTVGDGTLPRLEVKLETGIYTLFVASRAADPRTDISIRAALVSEWDAAATPKQSTPRLVRDGVDVTPPQEPQPAVTIDRLVALDLAPGNVENKVIALRGACVGTMARLVGAPEGASSCIDTEATSVALDEAPPSDAVPPKNSFGVGEDCSDQAELDGAVCMPAGAFLLGDRAAAGDEGPFNPSPERVARVGRFWLDRYEVTVGRFRKAIDDDFRLPDASQPFDNPNPLATSSGDGVRHQCTWLALPPDNSRERYPLSCIDRNSARAFCQFVGGELPTEAQWEYAATAAARAVDVAYPWGSELPSCDRAVYGRLTSPTDAPLIQKEAFVEIFTRLSGACGSEGFGPSRIDDAQGDPARDVTSLGVVGMGGNLSEWVLDAAHPFDHPCWRSQSLDNPACLDGDWPLHAVRGGSWAHGSFWTAGATRGARLPTAASEPPTYIGFRCAYDSPPDPEVYP